MGLLNIIRRMALREKLSIREISRRTDLSHNTIAKHLNDREASEGGHDRAAFHDARVAEQS